jgi:hypothetical protein
MSLESQALDTYFSEERDKVCQWVFQLQVGYRDAQLGEKGLVDLWQC